MNGVKLKPTILSLIFLLLCISLFSQEVVCEGSPCTSNDFTIDYFYLGDENGNEFSSGYCEPGTTVDAHLWINFTANSNANRYDLYLHFNLYVNGVFNSTIDDCFYDGQPIPTNVTLDTFNFNWECGSEIVLEDLYMSWQTNNHGSCECAQSHCYSNPTVIVLSPLIANFEFSPSCLTAFTVDFVSTTSGGTHPYTFLWEFGDGATSTEENPSHTYTSTGPFTVTLTVMDAEYTDSHGFEILNFDSNIPPELVAPEDIDLEGCDSTVIPILNYSETPIEITETEFINLGGNLVLGNDIVSLSYEDTSSGTCPIIITRTFTIIDTCNKTDTDVQIFAINDTILPTASNPEDISVQCISEVPVADVSVVLDADDNCSNPTVNFVSDVSDNLSCPETITRTYSVSDDCNNSIIVTQNIIISDDINPTASNPEDILIQCIEDIPIPNINAINDEADNCSTPTVTFVSDVSDNLSCPETISRSYSVTDACGNSINVTQNIIVNDDVLPTASNPADVNLQCIADIPPSDVSIITDEADNCSTPTVIFMSDVSDNLSCPETITRTYSVTDDCGNSINVTQNIIVSDDILPTASNPADVYVQCISDIPPSDLNIITDEADDCSIPTVSFVSDVSNNLSCPETITRTYSVTDECGNSISVTQNIIIMDDVLPTASNPANINVQCIGDVPTADINIISDESDNCSTPTVAFVSDVSDGFTCPQTITRTYIVIDDCDNSINVTQQIIVNDDVLPTASNPSPINLECGDEIPPPDINAITDEFDNCGIPSVFFLSDISDGACPEIITRTYEVVDSCGNSITVLQNLIFDDTVGPTLLTAYNDELTVDCTAIPDAPNLEFEDDCSTNITISYNETNTNDTNTVDYDIIREWTVTDECGNESVFTQTIHVIIDDCLTTSCNSCGIADDTIPPTASNPSDLVVSCTNDIPPPNPNVVTNVADNCVPPVVSFVSETINIDCFEKVIRVYRVTDECGNSIDVTHNINVVDDVLPTASNPPDLNVQCTEDVPAPEVKVVFDEADNCSTPTVEFVSDISNNECNEKITRTYSITDSCGNSITVQQIINVIDDVPPTASNPTTTIIQCIEDVPAVNTMVVDDEADNCSNPTVAFVSQISDNQSCSETITRTYSVTDACGNSINVTHTIIIDDDEAPTSSNLQEVHIQCLSELPAANILDVSDETDNCSIPTVAFVSDISNNLSCPETITRTYSVSDDCGNSINVTQLIIVNDDLKPTASNLETITLQCVSNIPSPDKEIVTDEADNCSIPTVAFVSDVSDGSSCPETITRTYSVTDDCNNSINVTQNFIINDDILPKASNPELITVQCIDDLPNPNPEVVTDETDNCSLPIVEFVSDISDNQTCPKTITRTYSVTDACNNTIFVTQSIIINDDEAPTASNPESLLLQCIGDLPTPNINVVADATDNCSTPTVAFVSEVSNGLTCPETIIRTYSVTDICNNSINVTQTIVVQDDIEPTASNPETFYAQCIGEVLPQNTNVVTDEADNCSNPTVAFVSETSDNQTCPETIIRTYSVTDHCGNSINVTQTIIINDDINPEMISNNEEVEFMIRCEEIPDVPIIEFRDNCSTDVDINFTETINTIDDSSYDIIRNWIASDHCNNQTSFKQTIHVRRLNENRVQIVDLCIDNSPIDLYTFISSVALNLEGHWESNQLDLLIDGVFNPADLPMGIYEFSYIFENNACSSINKFVIDLNDNCVYYPCIESTAAVTISKMVTPNKDGFNDFFEVSYVLNENSNDNNICDITTKVKIFNRWGKKIYESERDYQNDWCGDSPLGSIGKSNNLPTGTYYYIVDLKNSDLKPIQGYIYLGTE